MTPHMKVSLFCEKTGYTDKAVRGKIQTGVWREGIEYFRSPTGEITIDIEAYNSWAEGKQKGASRSAQPASASASN